MLSTSLILLSTLTLLHSCYSAHEATLLSTTLPRDIVVETLLSVLVLCLGIVLSNARELRAVSWAVWSGELEREKGVGPYGFLEERVGFLDIRAKRQEFTKWVKAAG